MALGRLFIAAIFLFKCTKQNNDFSIKIGECMTSKELALGSVISLLLMLATVITRLLEVYALV
ncbi:MAG: hypothetical protein RIQ74_1604 [Pseudomonadota bacterium]|jgi:hypothetical protein